VSAVIHHNNHDGGAAPFGFHLGGCNNLLRCIQRQEFLGRQLRSRQVGGEGAEQKQQKRVLNPFHGVVLSKMHSSSFTKGLAPKPGTLDRSFPRKWKSSH